MIDRETIREKVGATAEDHQECPCCLSRKTTVGAIERRLNRATGQRARYGLTTVRCSSCNSWWRVVLDYGQGNPPAMKYAVIAPGGERV